MELNGNKRKRHQVEHKQKAHAINTKMYLFSAALNHDTYESDTSIEGVN